MRQTAIPRFAGKEHLRALACEKARALETCIKSILDHVTENLTNAEAHLADGHTATVHERCDIAKLRAAHVFCTTFASGIAQLAERAKTRAECKFVAKSIVHALDVEFPAIANEFGSGRIIFKETREDERRATLAEKIGELDTMMAEIEALVVEFGGFAKFFRLAESVLDQQLMPATHQLNRLRKAHPEKFADIERALDDAASTARLLKSVIERISEENKRVRGESPRIDS